MLFYLLSIFTYFIFFRIFLSLFFPSLSLMCFINTIPGWKRNKCRIIASFIHTYKPHAHKHKCPEIIAILSNSFHFIPSNYLWNTKKETRNGKKYIRFLFIFQEMETVKNVWDWIYFVFSFLSQFWLLYTMAELTLSFFVFLSTIFSQLSLLNCFLKGNTTTATWNDTLQWIVRDRRNRWSKSKRMKKKN